MWVVPPLSGLVELLVRLRARQAGNELPQRALADTIPFSEDRTIDARPLIFFFLLKTKKQETMLL